MARPRWRKVLRSIWATKMRTALVVLSIAVGVFAVGTIAGAQTILSRDLAASYRSVNAAQATLHTTTSFDDGLVQTVRRMPQVGAAEGRRSVMVRLRIGPNQWRNLQLFAIADYEHMAIDKVQSIDGAWPPPRHTLLLERGSLQAQFGLSGERVGTTIHIRTAHDTEHDLPISGIAYDLNQAPSLFTGIAYGYITLDTLSWLGEPRDFNELHLTVADQPQDPQHVRQVAEAVRAKVEYGGRSVQAMTLPAPGKHPLDDLIAPVLLLLGVLSFLALLLSGFLVVNTISAVLAQEIRQIGVMKAIGANTLQITGLYIATVELFGSLAILIAMPLGVLGARGVSWFLAQMLGFGIVSYSIPLWVFAIEIAVGLILPLIAALHPIVSGARRTVYQALHSQGGAPAGADVPRLDQTLARLRLLPRPVMLSLRNTFRRRGRLLLTLTTLTLSGAIFIAVVSVRASMLQTLDDVMQYWQHDIWIDLDRPYRVDELQHEAQRVPGVARIEGWGFRTAARRVRADASESNNIRVLAPPATTTLVQPTILSGRWLLPDDQNAAVITTDLLKDEPDISVGDTVVLKMDERNSAWLVVGIVQGTRAAPTMYLNYPSFARVARTVGRASSMPVVTDSHAGAFQAQVAQTLEQHFKASGIGIASIDTNTQIRDRAKFQFDILVSLLSSMAVLLALVGGLGLMGTMSINVIDRTREIGVIRAIGASRRAVLQIVIVEGIVIGLLSWLVGTLLALPLSKVMCDAVGNAFWQEPLDYRFAVSGVLIWLGFVTILATVASALPAWNAARISVRSALAYE